MRAAFVRDHPVALTVAGSDSSAGAGLQADLKIFSARGVYGVCAVTSVVAEIPGKVSRLQLLEPEMVQEQIALLRSNFPLRAAKTGLLGNAAIARVVAREFQRDRKIPLVVDPVMVATSGERLLERDAIAIYESEIFPRADLLTPNLDEAAVLLGTEIRDLKAMRRAVRALSEKYRTAVLLKGGHRPGVRAIDLLCVAGRTIELSAAFVANVKTHGAGCAYSAAITAELAKGVSLVPAVRAAKRVVTAAIAGHFRWRKNRRQIDALNQMARSTGLPRVS